MASQWHWQPYPDLSQWANWTVCAQRPDDVKELGYVTQTDQDGHTTHPLRWVRLQSQHSRQPVSIRFANTTEDAVRLIWLDYEGHEVAYLLLEPEYYVKYRPPSAIAVSRSGKRLLIDGSEVFLPKEGSSEVEITEAPRLTWTLERHPYFPTDFKNAIKCFLLCHKADQCRDETPNAASRGVVQALWQRVRWLVSRNEPPHGLGRLPTPLVLKIVELAAEDVVVAQTLLKGLNAAPDLTLIDMSCLIS